MTILLIANYLPDRQNSMSRYATVLEKLLTAQGHTVVVSRPPNVLNRIPLPRFSKWLGYIDKYLIYPLFVWKTSRGFEQAHICDHSNAIYLPWLRANHISITCHDVLAIQAAEGTLPREAWTRPISWSGRVLQRWIKYHLLKARRVICVSFETKRCLQALGSTGYMQVIYNPPVREFVAFGSRGAALNEVPSQVRRTQSPFLLHVGGNQFYKNRHGVVRIFAALKVFPAFYDHKLVLAGHEPNNDLKELVSSLNLTHEVEFLILPSDRTVDALYSLADAFLFPSLFEGFGWPIVEAQCFGCPVITSDREPMREVSGNAAILIDPTDIVVTANHIVSQWQTRAEIATRGYQNAKRFDLELIGHQYDAFFKESIAASV